MKTIRTALSVALMSVFASTILLAASAMAEPGNTAQGTSNTPSQSPGGQEHEGMHHRGNRPAMTPEQMKAHREASRQRFATELNLTPDQQNKIHQLRKNFYESHRSQLEAMRADHKQMYEMKRSGVNEKDLAQRRQAMKARFESLRNDREQMRRQMDAILTPAQIQKMQALRAEHGSGRGHRGDRSNSQTGANGARQ